MAPERTLFRCWVNMSSSENLPVARLSWVLVCAVPWSTKLTYRLVTSIRIGLRLLSWWASVRRCVISLRKENGPLRQLLVLLCRFPTWLLMCLWVASTTIGARPCVCNVCNMLKLLSFGSTMLRMTIVQLSLSVRRKFLMLLCVMLMAQFRLARL